MLLCGDEHLFAVYPGALPADVCDAALAEAADIATQVGAAGHDSEGQIRQSTVQFFPLGHWLGEVLHGAAVRANAEANWNYGLLGPEAVQLASYAPGDRYGWHIDSYTEDGAARKLSVTAQLTAPDRYEGGELRFRRFGVPQEEVLAVPEAGRQRGSLIVFPSYLLHEVTPVTAGHRQSLVAWVRGPRFV